MIRKIDKVAVIGSGIMGGGIAALLASVGIKTLLLDILPSNLKTHEVNNYDARNKIVKNGLKLILESNPPLIMHQEDIKYISVGNLEDDFDKLGEYDWIIEVVIENLDIKRDLFKKIDLVRNLDSIVSTNTSGIPLKSMSEGLSSSFKKHFIGTHFFNPVRYMKLLEVIPGKNTSPEVLGFMINFIERSLGKGVVLAKDTPNFIANRIGIHGIICAMQLMVADNLTIPEVDTLFGRVLGRPKTGMFKTADIVGIDTLVSVAKNTFDLAPDDDFRNYFLPPKFVQKMVKNNLLGKKTNKGFYKNELTEDWKKIRKVIDPASMNYIDYKKPNFRCLNDASKLKNLSDKIRTIVYSDDKGSAFAWKVIALNLVYAVSKIPEISDNIVEIDNAMKWGFNFEIGLFEMWDIIGLEESVKKMKLEKIDIPEKINNMLLNGYKSFYKYKMGELYYFDFNIQDYKKLKVNKNVISLPVLKNSNKVIRRCESASLIDLNDDIFCIEFHNKMNVINEQVVDFMLECLDFIVSNGAGMVIGNQSLKIPGVFSAGGDLSFMSNLANEKKYSEIDSFLKKAQDVMQKTRYSNIPVVVAPYGITLGGGCEICLGVADKIVAHSDLYMGLVEIGVGLLPAGGGCLNLWKKMISSIPKVINDVDLSKFFIPAFMNIAMAKVSMSAAEAKFNGFLGNEDRIIFNRDHLISEAKKEVLKLVADGYYPPIKQAIKVLGAAARGMINAEIFNMKSAKYISSYDAFLVKRIAYVMSGGDVRTNSEVDEDVVLRLEREAFIDFWKQEKTLDRVKYMLENGKPLRN